MNLIEFYKAITMFGAGIGQKMAEEIRRDREDDQTQIPDYVPEEWKADNE
jgi:hypothetical protein